MYERRCAEMTQQDWENIRLQLRTLVDIYCEMNNDIVKIKDVLKAMARAMSKRKKKKSPKKKLASKPKAAKASTQK